MSDAYLTAAKIVGALDHYLYAREWRGRDREHESPAVASERFHRNRAAAHDQLVQLLAEALRRGVHE